MAKVRPLSFLDRASACGECGALVVDVEEHTRWHNSLMPKEERYYSVEPSYEQVDFYTGDG